jgi:hypothetical protein
MTPATERNAILDSAEAITSDELAQRRIELAEPVSAKFHTDEVGSMGIELTVRLRDSRSIAAAKAAIAERFGGIARCDALIVT